MRKSLLLIEIRMVYLQFLSIYKINLINNFPESDRIFSRIPIGFFPGFRSVFFPGSDRVIRSYLSFRPDQVGWSDHPIILPDRVPESLTDDRRSMKRERSSWQGFILSQGCVHLGGCVTSGQVGRQGSAPKGLVHKDLRTLWPRQDTGETGCKRTIIKHDGLEDRTARDRKSAVQRKLRRRGGMYPPKPLHRRKQPDGPWVDAVSSTTPSKVKSAILKAKHIRRRLYWPIGQADRPSRSTSPIGFVPTSRSAKRKKPIGQTKKTQKSRSAKCNKINKADRLNEIKLIKPIG